MLILSAGGSVLAGELLAHLKVSVVFMRLPKCKLRSMQTWTAFQRVPELFILIPILLNLKGNIEMNLAARFSTSANIGELDIQRTRQTLVLGNLALLQVQALLVSLLAGLIAFILGFFSRVATPASTEEIGGYFECLTVLVASMMAAGMSSAVVGSFMCALVVLSRKWRINPDNIATPLAASLGDLLSLVMLGLVSAVLVRMMGEPIQAAFDILS